MAFDLPKSIIYTISIDIMIIGLDRVHSAWNNVAGNERSRWTMCERKVVDGSRALWLRDWGLGSIGVIMSIDRSSQQNEKSTARSAAGPPPDSVLEQIRHAIKSIQYGEVRVVIQDHVIVQIERVEKQRFR
jgi:hypothetical protein